MRSSIVGGLLVLLWILLMAKTILVFLGSGANATHTYYSGMMQNTWQGQFNLDLFFLTIVFSTWMVYRDASKIRGTVFGLLNIYLGGIFTLAYLAVIFLMPNKGRRWLKIAAVADSQTP